METIPFKNCTQIGFLQKPHGVMGEVSLIFQEEFIESVEEARMFLLNIDEGLVPFFIEDDEVIISSAKKANIKLRWVDSQEKAREISGFEVWLKNKDVVKTLDESAADSFVGFQLFDQNKNKIGEITAMDDYSCNIVLTVNYNGNYILVPFNENLIKEIDTAEKTLMVEIPEGLLDLE